MRTMKAVLFVFLVGCTGEVHDSRESLVRRPAGGKADCTTLPPLVKTEDAFDKVVAFCNYLVEEIQGGGSSEPSEKIACLTTLKFQGKYAETGRDLAANFKVVANCLRNRSPLFFETSEIAMRSLLDLAKKRETRDHLSAYASCASHYGIYGTDAVSLISPDVISNRLVRLLDRESLSNREKIGYEQQDKFLFQAKGEAVEFVFSKTPKGWQWTGLQIENAKLAKEIVIK